MWIKWRVSSSAAMGPWWYYEYDHGETDKYIDQSLNDEYSDGLHRVEWKKIRKLPKKEIRERLDRAQRDLKCARGRIKRFVKMLGDK